MGCLTADDKSRMKPWHTAAQHGSLSVLERHFEEGHDLKSRCYDVKWNILHIAAMSNKPDIINFILNNHIIPVDTLDTFRRTPLFVAVQYQKSEAAVMLLKHCSDQTIPATMKMTSLGLSAYFLPELTPYLLDE